jgi:hypothetical protein
MLDQHIATQMSLDEEPSDRLVSANIRQRVHLLFSKDLRLPNNGFLPQGGLAIPVPQDWGHELDSLQWIQRDLEKALVAERVRRQGQANRLQSLQEVKERLAKSGWSDPEKSLQEACIRVYGTPHAPPERALAVIDQTIVQLERNLAFVTRAVAQMEARILASQEDDETIRAEFEAEERRREEQAREERFQLHRSGRMNRRYDSPVLGGRSRLGGQIATPTGTQEA